MLLVDKLKIGDIVKVFNTLEMVPQLGIILDDKKYKRLEDNFFNYSYYKCMVGDRVGFIREIGHVWFVSFKYKESDYVIHERRND